MRFDILTLFPGVFSGFIAESILAKAIQKKLLEVHLHQLRDWSNDAKHHKVDDRPFGGGPGMLLQVGPVVEGTEAVEQLDVRPAKRILLSPQGRRLDQTAVERLAGFPRLLVICGRYEGFDQRVIDILQPEEVSVGDYILNGGEVAAMVLVEAVSRLVPGVLGDDRSHQEDSFSGGEQHIEFPQYTRPRVYRNLEVPSVLVGGNHEEVNKWRAEQSRLRTIERNKFS
jgi:tRNA (guanine37-N1)-methyltransferase